MNIDLDKSPDPVLVEFGFGDLTRTRFVETTKIYDKLLNPNKLERRKESPSTNGGGGGVRAAVTADWTGQSGVHFHPLRRSWIRRRSSAREGCVVRLQCDVGVPQKEKKKRLKRTSNVDDLEECSDCWFGCEGTHNKEVKGISLAIRCEFSYLDNCSDIFACLRPIFLFYINNSGFSSSVWTSISVVPDSETEHSVRLCIDIVFRVSMNFKVTNFGLLLLIDGWNQCSIWHILPVFYQKLKSNTL